MESSSLESAAMPRYPHKPRQKTASQGQRQIVSPSTSPKDKESDLKISNKNSKLREKKRQRLSGYPDKVCRKLNNQ